MDWRARLESGGKIMHNPNQKSQESDQGRDPVHPDDIEIKPGPGITEPEEGESRTSEAVRARRSETSPPVKPISLPM